MKGIVVIGAGGHARVVIDALQSLGRAILAALDRDASKAGSTLLGVPVLDQSAIDSFDPSAVMLANGIGGVGDTSPRREIFQHFQKKGYKFATVQHPSAIVSRHARLSEGAQIMAGVVLQASAEIGVNAIVNTGAQVDHDCRIGGHAHIAPGAVLSGGVMVEEAAHIGAGAIILQNLRVGAGAVVGAGSLVNADVATGVTVVGTPARLLERTVAISPGEARDRRL